MSKCLTDERLQAVADREGTAGEAEHVAACDACRARVAELRATVQAFAHRMSGVQVPRHLRAQVVAAVERSTADRRGATTLRPAARTLRPRPAWVFAGGALLAMIIAIIFVLLPSVDPGTRLNAAEILNRSIQTLAREGVELLDYELSIDAPGSGPFAVERGTYRIEQAIDHTTGRWRFTRYTSDGALLHGIAEDPGTHTRDIQVRLHGRVYRFHFTVAPGEEVKLWDTQRRAAEAMIRLVQLSANHVVTLQPAGERQQYVIELPHAASAQGAPFDLSRARVVIDAGDYHIVEFSAAGAAMGQPVALGFRLLKRTVGAASTSPSLFALPGGGGDAIELAGAGTSNVGMDLFSMLLGELARPGR